MRLIKAGYSIRGLVRDEEKAREVKALGIEPAVGNLDDIELLMREAKAEDNPFVVAEYKQPRRDIGLKVINRSHSA
ncbi:hypothetical protein [Pseudomonas sp.]|uniref:hypothetical protein n=1 Tax=Pseudomonas sp. TaxID=306 RepID=UPI0026378070|nr:hypothetical protein [Pseudomonas sp.]